MSYCRWSSEEFKSDVYVYEDVRGGWTTHVAGSKFVDHGAANKYSPENLIPIGLEFDGDSFNDPTPGECAERLLKLREAGYHVPQYAVDALKTEQAEIDADATRLD